MSQHRRRQAEQLAPDHQAEQLAPDHQAEQLAPDHQAEQLAPDHQAEQLRPWAGSAELDAAHQLAAQTGKSISVKNGWMHPDGSLQLAS